MKRSLCLLAFSIATSGLLYPGVAVAQEDEPPARFFRDRSDEPRFERETFERDMEERRDAEYRRGAERRRAVEQSRQPILEFFELVEEAREEAARDAERDLPPAEDDVRRFELRNDEDEASQWRRLREGMNALREARQSRRAERRAWRDDRRAEEGDQEAETLAGYDEIEFELEEDAAAAAPNDRTEVDNRLLARKMERKAERKAERQARRSERSESFLAAKQEKKQAKRAMKEQKARWARLCAQCFAAREEARDERQARTDRRVGRGQIVLSGKVLATKPLGSRNRGRLLAVLETDAGELRLVDLGRRRAVKRVVREGSQITVRGVPVRFADRGSILAARRAEIDNRNFRLLRLRARDLRTEDDRGRLLARRDREGFLSREQREARRESRQLARLDRRDREPLLERDRDRFMDRDRRAERRVERREERQLARAERRDGERRLLDRDREERPGLLARMRAERSERDGSLLAALFDREHVIQGEVTAIRKVTIQGNTRQLATVRTDEGKTMFVDLGPSDQFPLELERGDQITAEGLALGARQKRLLLARHLQRGEESADIPRFEP